MSKTYALKNIIGNFFNNLLTSKRYLRTLLEFNEEVSKHHSNIIERSEKHILLLKEMINSKQEIIEIMLEIDKTNNKIIENNCKMRENFEKIIKIKDDKIEKLEEKVNDI